MKRSPAQKNQDFSKDRGAFDYFRNKLKLKNIQEEQNLFQTFPGAKKAFEKRSLGLKNIREHSAKLLGAGILSSSFLLGTPSAMKSLPEPHEIYDFKSLDEAFKNLKSKNQILTDIFKDMLPSSVRPLSRNEEKVLEILIKDATKIPVKANLEGEHLNTIYGLIGAEQHLKRYPGDSVYDHGSEDYQKVGMAPGLGAWGYFSKSEKLLTDSLVETEKWYAVVQTLYLPDWNTRQPYLKDWYKYRKVMIINTENGNAVVCAIADSGPAAWTGKSFGGSPEVMDYLGGLKYKKGKVLVFFVDDPENVIPLGPVDYGEVPVFSYQV